MILAAAGSGKRMGLSEPKQFLEYEGKALFLHSLLAAEHSIYIHEIVLVCQEEYQEEITRLCSQEKIGKLNKIVVGGKERQDSIFAGLQALGPEVDYVFVQDAARPFCKAKYFEACYQALEEGYMGAVVGVPVKDTVKVIEGNRIVETPRRDTLFAAHTPQAFPRDILEQSYQAAKAEHFFGTDDSSLVERYLLQKQLPQGIQPILGDYDNIKITVFEDLRFLNPSQSSQK